MVDNFKVCFTVISNVVQVDRFIGWNSASYSCAIANVDGSCLSTSVRAGYAGIIRNSADFLLIKVFRLPTMII